MAAAQDQAQRVAKALAEMRAREAERARWAAKHPGSAVKTPKAELRVSTTDPDARMMRVADDAMRPCFTIQLATASGFVVAAGPTNQCNDHDLTGIMVGEVQRTCGGSPDRLLADAGAMTHADRSGASSAWPGRTPRWSSTPRPSSRIAPRPPKAGTAAPATWPRSRSASSNGAPAHGHARG